MVALGVMAVSCERGTPVQGHLVRKRTRLKKTARIRNLRFLDSVPEGELNLAFSRPSITARLGHKSHSKAFACTELRGAKSN